MITTIQSENRNQGNVAHFIAPMCRKSWADLSTPGLLLEYRSASDPKAWMNWVLGICRNSGLRCSRKA